eukprot:g11789.t1
MFGVGKIQQNQRRAYVEGRQNSIICAHLCKFLSCYLLSVILTLLYVGVSTYLLNGYLDPNECIEFPENPEYYVIQTGSSSDHEVYGRYRLVYVHIQKPWGQEDKSFSLEKEDIWSGAPVLFVPGHSGSYNQSKTIAAQVQSQLPSSKSSSPIHFFALDFREDLSAFSGHFLEAQAEFINTCVRFILDNCNARANEKGVVGPKSVLIIAHSMGGISARGAVFAKNYLQGSILTIITMNTPHQAISPLMTDRKTIHYYSKINGLWHAATSAAAAKFPTLVVSIAGGHRDTKIRSDLTSLKNIVEGRYNYLHVWTGAMDGVWVENDHDSVMWCGQLIIVLAQTLIDLLDTENNGGQFVYDKLARYSVIRRGLIGNQVDDLFNDAPIFEHSFTHHVPTMVPRTMDKAGDALIHLEDIKSMPYTKCVGLTGDSHEGTDVAFSLITNASTPFLERSLSISICESSDCKSCKNPMRVTEMMSKIKRFPNGARRTHLHHSYDPEMNFGERRHVYKWTRASMEALVDSFENDRNLGGSLNVLHMPPSTFHNGHNSVRLSFFERSIHPHMQNIENKIMFVSGHFYSAQTRGKEDSIVGADTSYNSNTLFSLFLYLCFGIKDIFLQVGHPFVVDISPIVRKYNNRFLPQTLSVELVECRKRDPYLTQTLKKKTKNLNEEYFQPVVRSGFYNDSFVRRNQVRTNIEQVEESVASPRPRIYPQNEQGKTVYRYSINGHYRVSDSAIVDVISDPFCSYKLALGVDWWSLPSTMNRYILPKAFSLTFAVAFIVLSMQFCGWKRNGKLPLALPDAIFRTIYTFYIIIALTFLANLKIFCFCGSTNQNQMTSLEIKAAPSDCDLSTLIYFLMAVISIGCIAGAHAFLALASKFMQMVALFYIYVYCCITGVPPFDGRVRKRSRSNSNPDVEQQHAEDTMIAGRNAADAASFVDVWGNSVVDKRHPISKKTDLVYFCIRLFAFYAMLCLRPLLFLAVLMVYKAFKCAYVDAEITYTNLTYRPANEVNSFIYAFRQIFCGGGGGSTAVGNNNKDVGLESILLLNLIFVFTQITTLLLDIKTLFLYSRSDIPFPYFEAFMLLPGKLIIQNGVSVEMFKCCIFLDLTLKHPHYSGP